MTESSRSRSGKLSANFALYEHETNSSLSAASRSSSGDAPVHVSVCMATFNGEKFVRTQLDSILEQLGPHDEVVIVDDCSIDATRTILDGYLDPRIKLHTTPANRGIVPSFERAMSLARGQVIVLSDQDDEWLPGRLTLMLDAMQRTGALVAASNWAFMNPGAARAEFKVQPLRERDSDRHLANVFRVFSGNAAYYGCTMAFRRSMLEFLLPIPKWVESHDLWIALAGNVLGGTTHIERITLARRVHDRNASLVSRTLYMKVRARFIMLMSIASLVLRLSRRSL